MEFCKLKKFFSLFCVLLALNTCLNAKGLEDLIKPYIDFNNKGAGFLAKNPMYYSPEHFVPELKPIAGKIIKETDEDYEITEAGIKSYGDSEERTFVTSYYVFDKNGCITDEYTVSKEESGYIFSKFHSTYKYENNKFTVITENLAKNTQSIEEYTITKNDSQLIFSRDYKNKTYQIILSPEK